MAKGIYSSLEARFGLQTKIMLKKRFKELLNKHKRSFMKLEAHIFSIINVLDAFEKCKKLMERKSLFSLECLANFV